MSIRAFTCDFQCLLPLRLSPPCACITFSHLRDRATGKPLRQVCLFRHADAAARCAIHPKCSAISCLEMPTSDKGGRGSQPDRGGGGDPSRGRSVGAIASALKELSRERVEAESTEICLAYQIALDETIALVSVRHSLCSSRPCTTRVLPSPKDQHSRYMLTPSERNQTYAAVAVCEERVAAVASNRSAVEHKLDLIGAWEGSVTVTSCHSFLHMPK